MHNLARKKLEHVLRTGFFVAIQEHLSKTPALIVGAKKSFLEFLL